MPRVSVITPAYNAGPYLSETLASVRAQTFDDWEVVLADDGSADDTIEIARGFGDRLRVVPTPGRVGPAGARNVAIGEARGELLALLDADDLWEPTFLEEQVAFYDREQEREPDVGIVSSDAYFLFPDGRADWTFEERYGAGGDEIDLTKLLETNPIYGGAMVPRAVVQEVGGFSPETWGTEDHDLWIRIVERGYRVVINPRPLASYRVGTGASVTANLEGMARTNQATYRLALERGNLDPKQQKIARRHLRFYEALEELATFRSDGRSFLRLAKAMPLFLSVALREPRRWPRWIRALATGKVAEW